MTDLSIFFRKKPRNSLPKQAPFFEKPFSTKKASAAPIPGTGVFPLYLSVFPHIVSLEQCRREESRFPLCRGKNGQNYQRLCFCGMFVYICP